MVILFDLSSYILQSYLRLFCFLSLLVKSIGSHVAGASLLVNVCQKYIQGKQFILFAVLVKVFRLQQFVNVFIQVLSEKLFWVGARPMRIATQRAGCRRVEASVVLKTGVIKNCPALAFLHSFLQISKFIGKVGVFKSPEPSYIA